MNWSRIFRLMIISRWKGNKKRNKGKNKTKWTDKTKHFNKKRRDKKQKKQLLFFEGAKLEIMAYRRYDAKVGRKKSHLSSSNFYFFTFSSKILLLCDMAFWVLAGTVRCGANNMGNDRMKQCHAWLSESAAFLFWLRLQELRCH